MKTNKVTLSVVAAGCLLFSGLGLAFASPEQPVHAGFEAVPEQLTTNVLLRQILAEVIKGNAQKAENRCSDGEKQYSPGYVISSGKKHSVAIPATDIRNGWRTEICD